MNSQSSIFSESLLANPEKSGLALESRLDEVRADIRRNPPPVLAERTLFEITFLQSDSGHFSLTMLGDAVEFSFPELVARNHHGEILSPVKQGLLMYHLAHSDGQPATGRWISFSELPGGRVYAQAFQGYSGNRVAALVGLEMALFADACLRAGGQPSGYGDSSFVFRALPRVPLLVVYHVGDDEFPSSCKILFDASAPHHLPVDACAILGSMLASRITSAVISLKKET